MSHGHKHANRLQEKLERGESSEVQGMLEQWLREKKITTEEAVAMSSGMITSGVHTVCMYLHSCGFTSVKTDCLSDSIPPV